MVRGVASTCTCTCTCSARRIGITQIHLLFSPVAAATTLHTMLTRHAAVLPTRFPTLHRPTCGGAAAAAAPPPPGLPNATGGAAAAAAAAGAGAGASSVELRPFVLEYLLDAVREGQALGCYLPIYPSAAAAGRFLRHMQTLHRFAWREPRPPSAAATAGSGGGGWSQAADGAQQPSSAVYESETEYAECMRRESCGDEGEGEGGGGGDDTAASGSGWCGFEPASRIEMHGLLQLLLHSGGGGAAWQEPYKVQCERMLRAVPHVPQGAWGQRTHVFREVPDVPL
jgi:hypothetical protein